MENPLLLEKERIRYLRLSRLLCLECLSKVVMATEEFAAFCIAFLEPLNKLPDKILQYETSDINEFYKKLDERNNDYFMDLLMYKKIDDYNLKENKDKLLLEKVMKNNILYTRLTLTLFKEFRNKHLLLYNKYKHSNPLLINLDIANEPMPHSYDTIFYFNNEMGFDKIKASLIGKIPNDRYIRLINEYCDILKELIMRRIYLVVYQGDTHPPYELLYKNEDTYTESEKEKYREVKTSLTPKKRVVYPVDLPNVKIDVRKEYSWFNSSIWVPEYNTHREIYDEFIEGHMELIRKSLSEYHKCDLNEIELRKVSPNTFSSWMVRYSVKGQSLGANNVVFDIVSGLIVFNKG